MSNRVRILHLCSSIDPASGGPANVLDRLSRLQASAGHDVSVVTADDPAVVGGIIESLRLAGVNAQAGGPPTGPLAKGSRVLAMINGVIRAGIDIGHIHGVWQHTPHWGSAMLRRARVPYVFRPCGMLDPWSLRQGALKKKLFLALRGRRDLNGAAAIHYTTETERRLAGPLNLRPKEFVIPNGIELGEFDPPPERGVFRREQGIADDAPLVVFLSRLHYKKGIELLLPAFKDAAPAGAVLALCGPGEDDYVRSLRALAETLGIAARVKFTGMLKGRARLLALADADIFCLPSYQENFGVVVVEAAAAGAAVLISDQVNIWDEVVCERAGEACPCDVPALAAKLRAMLGDLPGTRRIGERGRAWARTFDWSKISGRIEAMYREVLAR